MNALYTNKARFFRARSFCVAKRKCQPKFTWVERERQRNRDRERQSQRQTDNRDKADSRQTENLNSGENIISQGLQFRFSQNLSHN